ncbi:hypothetical protein ACFWOB_24550 [Streptomyces sp. NPDC058420]|uniref:hypothetical protein n=1 Tax=Streptomyces sp. NPDC058420 TaxID=3346489 RepID=UPI003650D5ED
MTIAASFLRPLVFAGLGGQQEGASWVPRSEEEPMYDRGMGGDELGTFLSARRSRLSPQDLGFPGSTDRRMSGLRREEVVVLAGVGADYTVAALRLGPRMT